MLIGHNEEKLKYSLLGIHDLLHHNRSQGIFFKELNVKN